MCLFMSLAHRRASSACILAARSIACIYSIILYMCYSTNVHIVNTYVHIV